MASNNLTRSQRRRLRLAQNTLDAAEDEEIYVAERNPVDGGTIRTHTDMSQLMVAAAGARAYQSLRSVPHTAGNECDQIGAKEIRAMLQDYEVQSAFGPVVAASAGKVGSVEPCITNPDDPEHSKAVLLAEYMQHVIDNMAGGIKKVQQAMTHDSLAYGSSVAEIQQEVIDSGPFRGLTGIKRIRTLCLDDTALVLDQYDAIVGIIPLRTKTHNFTVNTTVPFTQIGEDEDQLLKGVLPRSKFIVQSWNEGCGDPRGRSILQAAYEPWKCKWDAAYMMKVWLDKFSSASVIGNLPENASPTCEEDEDGNLINCDDPATDFLMMLQQFQSNSAIAIPHDASVQIVQATGNVDSFLQVIDWADRAITRSILYQNLATQEGQHQARAASETHKDILSLFILCVKSNIAETIERDVFRPLVERHFPDCVHLTPIYDLGLGNGFPLTATDIASLISVGYLHRSQFPEIDKLLDLPQREVSVNEEAVTQQGIVIPDGFATLLQSDYLSPSQYELLDQALGLPSRSEEDLQRIIDEVEAGIALEEATAESEEAEAGRSE